MQENERLKKSLNAFLVESYRFKDAYFDDLTVAELRALFEANKQLVGQLDSTIKENY
jgi:hypothetical protein